MNLEIKKSNPSSIRKPFGNYVHGISIPKNYSVLLTSGQLGTSKDDATPERAADQARICFNNVAAILKTNGLDFSHVVKVTAYVTSRDYFPEYMAVRDEFISEPVTSTLLIVNGFTRPEFKVELEVIAAYADPL